MNSKRTKINLRVLVKMKEIADGRDYTYQDVADGAGVHVDLIQRMMNGNVKNLPIAKADKILRWLGADWGDLLVRVEEETEEDSSESKTPLRADREKIPA